MLVGGTVCWRGRVLVFLARPCGLYKVQTHRGGACTGLRGRSVYLKLYRRARKQAGNCFWGVLTRSLLTS